jgi:hypothetical protein
LRARLDEMGDAPDYSRLAAEVLGIRNAPFDLARRLVSQALVLEDRREEWRRVGERVCAEAPTTAGVYVLRDPAGTVLYVGKAINLRRRLRTHFAARRWRGLKAPLARTDAAEWHEVGSELEALLREATLIRDLRPLVNVQVGPPDLHDRSLPAALVKDVIVILPSVAEDSAELVAARAEGDWMMQRTRRSGADVAVQARRLFRFFHSPLRRGEDTARLAPIVFSWLAGRGAASSRLDPNDAPTLEVLQSRLATLLAADGLFTERIVVR